MRKVISVKVISVFVIIAIISLLGGCCCVCPTCPQETHPNVLAQIAYCDLLQKAREWTPLAEYRWMKSEHYDLVSKEDIEWALAETGQWECCIGMLDLIDLFHQVDGYQNVPFGYIVNWDLSMKNVVVYMGTDGPRALMLVNGKLVEITSNPDIYQIVM
jgi:hypothetical protein